MVNQANQEVYAADAGVENMIWNVTKDVGTLPAEGNTITKDIPDQTINGMGTVTTTLTNVGGRMYRINSIATRPDGHGTEVEAFINCLNFDNLLKGAITSNGNIEIRNATVDGNVFYSTTATINNSTLIPPVPQQETQTNWPTWDDLQPLYWSQVKDYPFSSNSILAENYPGGLGPLHVEGTGDLNIGCNTTGTTLTLTGCIYVPGNLTFTQSGSKTYVLNMNNQTLFVGGDINMPSKCIDIIGSGCIIARHNILFQPGTEAGSPSDYVLVLSLEGNTTMQPSGNFYGSLVGSSTVELQPGGYIKYTDPYSHDLNFPGLQIGGQVPFSSEGRIVSYIIK